MTVQPKPRPVPGPARRIPAPRRPAHNTQAARHAQAMHKANKEAQRYREELRRVERELEATRAELEATRAELVRRAVAAAVIEDNDGKARYRVIPEAVQEVNVSTDEALNDGIPDQDKIAGRLADELVDRPYLFRTV